MKKNKVVKGELKTAQRNQNQNQQVFQEGTYQTDFKDRRFSEF
jgi:hypothetical protein